MNYDEPLANPVLPCHIYAVDYRPPSANNGTGDILHHELQYVRATNLLVWAAMKLDNVTTGVADQYNGMTCVYSSQGTALTGVFPNKSVLKTLTADFILRGIASRPVTYKIQFVQLLHPDVFPTAASNSEGSKVWGDYIKPSLVSPLSYNPRDTHFKQHIKVLKTYYKKFQPDETNNKDSVPIQQRFTIRFDMNRYCDYTARSNPSQNITNLNANDGIQGIVEQGNTYTGNAVYNQKARVYMIVSATVYDKIADSTAASIALCPQYDLVLNATHVLPNPL